MSEEKCKYVQILEREDQEFRRAMQEEVSIILILLNLVVNNGILAGAGVITQCKKELSILKYVHSVMLQMLHNFTSLLCFPFV